MRISGSTLVTTFFLSVSCVCNGTSWSPIAVIPENLDGIFHSGTEFVSYRLAPSFNIYCSDNGTNWTQHASALQPLSVGHDGHGTIYTLTRTQTEGPSGWYSYTAHIWRSQDAESWEHVVDLATYFEIIPTSASFVASDDNLLIKLRTIWGAGLVSGVPPQPVFVADRANPTNFIEVTEGDSLNNLMIHDDRFTATREGSESYAVQSVNGTAWEELFSMGISYPSREVIAAWRSLYFVHGWWTSLAVQSELSGRLDVDTPVDFGHGLNSLRDVAYDGMRLVLVGDSKCWLSADYAQTWSTTTFTSVSGFAQSSDTYLITDSVGTETVVYSLTVPTNIQAEVQEASLNIDILPQHQLALYPMTTNHFYQLECSKDLNTWHLYSIPTTNYPFVVNTTSLNSPTMFFRARKLVP
jgi:hypothetical protein